MLALKKISTKKLAIYFFIIFFMICGSIFMLYQNKKLTAYKVTTINAPTLLNNQAKVGNSATSSLITVNKTASTTNQNINFNNSDFDLSIFSTNKFKNLQETQFIIKSQPETGKRDPFKPN